MCLGDLGYHFVFQLQQWSLYPFLIIIIIIILKRDGQEGKEERERTKKPKKEEKWIFLLIKLK